MPDARVHLQTLIFVRQDEKILLGMKLRGFGEGKWNGYGGKVEEMETLKKCAKRELYEESELIVEENDLKNLGFIQFNQHGKTTRRVHIYTTENYTGIVKQTAEMRPNWFGVDEIPYREMFEDAHYWMPLMLRNEQFEATFGMEDDEKIVSIHIDIKS